MSYDPNQPIYTQAFDAVRPELEAMPPERVEPIRHDIMAAIILALGTVPNARRLRPQVVAQFGEAAAQHIDRLEVVARACGKAHALHLTTLHGTDVEAMAGQLSQTRSVLLHEVEALIQSAALPSSIVGELVGGTSYRGMCLDVLQLVSALRHGWAAVSAQTGVSTLELDQAEALANAFATTLGENEQGSVGSPTADMRRRAYTLFVHTHSEVRRLVTFFRFDAGDADTLAPPLGSNRARTRSSSDTDAEPTELVTPDVVPTPVVATPDVDPGMPGAPPLAVG